MDCNYGCNGRVQTEALRVSEVASYLGLHPKTVCAYIREGKIRAIRCGRSYRIRKEWLDEFIERELAG